MIEDGKKKTYPALDVKTGVVESPHVVILGAGASCACCPNGDKNGRKLPVMANLVTAVGIQDLVSKAGYDPSSNFEAIFSDAHNKKNASFLSSAEDAVRAHFAELELPSGPTVYDYLLLSLRSKDLIVSFNWDPLLPQAFRRWRHLGEVLPQIVFPHGNVDVVINPEARAKRFAPDVRKGEQGFKPSHLLFPIEKKDYASDPFIKNEWELCTEYLKHAYCATVFGYSAPVTDVEARQLLLNAWNENTTSSLAEFNVIDIRPASEIKRSWSDFGGLSVWSVDDFRKTRLWTYPRRTCEGLAHATLQQRPWQEDPFADAESLEELNEWIKPVLAEEASGKLVGKRHH